MLGAVLTLGVAAVFLVIAAFEGGFFEEFGDLGGFVRWVVDKAGSPGAIALLYVEESGIPLPVPGDVWVVYVGTRAAGSLPRLALTWVSIVVVVVAGASNLYLVARRYGRRLVEHRVARLLHLDQERLEQAERAFRRWGVLMIIFGRHVPGFRIPITVVAGTFGIPYRLFAPSVAVSTAIWAGFWLLLANRFGSSAVHFLSGHHVVYVVALVLIALSAAFIAVRAWLRAGRPLPRPTS